VLQLPGQADFYFVGRAGALRRGKTTATSIPADTTKAKLWRRRDPPATSRSRHDRLAAQRLPGESDDDVVARVILLGGGGQLS